MKTSDPSWLPEVQEEIHQHQVSRRGFLSRTAAGSAGLGLAAGLSHIEAVAQQVESDSFSRAVIPTRSTLRIADVETFIHRNSWVFVKITTDAGIVGWGEMLKDKARACAAEVLEQRQHLLGQDPRRITYIWQSLYKHGFYRGGPVLSAVLSGIDMALWDIRGKALGLPVYELLGGAVRDRIRIYGSQNDVVQGRAFAFKTQLRAFEPLGQTDGPGQGARQAIRYSESPAYIDGVVEYFGGLRERFGRGVQIGVEFHGASQPQAALKIMKALEEFDPMFYEEPIQSENLDVIADLARQTHIPIAIGERVYTKWGFREVLEKKAASIIQPDVCYAGGITELRLIAGMAEAHFVPLAPHNPQGPCSLAASCQIAATIPNFLIQERGTDTHANMLRNPFQAADGFLPLPTGPGLGIEFDEDRFMALVGDPRPYPRTFDAGPDGDGAPVDW
jgi:galactonate dehydratase